jgi:diguanylate cyclase (GGDEF)-like protein
LEKLNNSEKLVVMNIKKFQFLVAATNYRKRINGAISVWNLSSSKPWDEDHFFLIRGVANQLGIANEQINNHERIVALSRTDSMTGLLNRRAFFEEDLPRRISRLRRNREMAALFFVDMDNFKQVNDRHGHQAGDDALLILRDLLMDMSRPGDVVARLGGDEFAMWLDGVSPEVTKKRAAKLIKASECLLEFSGDEYNPLGISVGVAIFNPDDDEPLDELVARADEAMYQVKNAEKRGFHVAAFPMTKKTP